jgi:DNA polymerase
MDVSTSADHPASQMNAAPPLTDPVALLRWYADAGVEDCSLEEAQDRYALSARPAPAAAAPRVQPPPARGMGEAPSAPTAPAVPPPRTPVPLESPRLVEDARAAAAAANTLAELEAAIRAFEGCTLKRLAKNTVFADGVPGSPVMIVGEAPGEDEDRLGKPFVGVSGQLMDRMFAAIGMSRSRDLYITNILPWRPPGNRTPSVGDSAICVAFARRHVELARPKILVLAGGVAAKNMLETEQGITRLRGKWFDYTLSDGTRIPAMPLFHPAYLLRTPAGKRQAWMDLVAVAKRLEALV